MNGRNLFAFALVVLAPLTLLAATDAERELFRFRVHRIYLRYQQSPEKRAFDEKLKALLAAPTAKLDKLVPYATCVEHHRKLGVGKLGDVDLAVALCQEEKVQKNEAALLKERAEADKEIAGMERSFRLVSLAAETMAGWRREMRELSKTFETSCKRDVPCLERKQVARYRQLLLSVGALVQVDLAVRHIGTQLPNSTYAAQAMGIRDGFEKTVYATLEELFQKIARREDLPW
jgi:hypothetical protein